MLLHRLFKTLLPPKEAGNLPPPPDSTTAAQGGGGGHAWAANQHCLATGLLPTLVVSGAVPQRCATEAGVTMPAWGPQMAPDVTSLRSLLVLACSIPPPKPQPQPLSHLIIKQEATGFALWMRAMLSDPTSRAKPMPTEPGWWWPRCPFWQHLLAPRLLARNDGCAKVLWSSNHLQGLTTVEAICSSTYWSSFSACYHVWSICRHTWHTVSLFMRR